MYTPFSPIVKQALILLQLGSNKWPAITDNTVNVKLLI